MEYLSVAQFAEKYSISERTARNYCAEGKIKGAFLTGEEYPEGGELDRSDKLNVPTRHW